MGDMILIYLLGLILILSFILALRSMRDFGVPKEVRKLFRINKIQGTIMFFKEKVKHYKT